jgi:hypothetical protein
MQGCQAAASGRGSLAEDLKARQAHFHDVAKGDSDADAQTGRRI